METVKLSALQYYLTGHLPIDLLVEYFHSLFAEVVGCKMQGIDRPSMLSMGFCARGVQESEDCVVELV